MFLLPCCSFITVIFTTKVVQCGSKEYILAISVGLFLDGHLPVVKIEHPTTHLFELIKKREKEQSTDYFLTIFLYSERYFNFQYQDLCKMVFDQKYFRNELMQRIIRHHFKI